MDPSHATLPAQSLLEHQSFVRELARRLLRDEDAAEDLAQETLTRWIERAPALQNPRAWLRRVTQNLASHHLRARSNRSAREEEAARPEALASAAEEAERASVLRTVVDAVLALEEPYRTTVLLRYFRGWKAKRVASSMNLPEATVRTRERRALAMLRGQLDEEHGDRDRWVNALTPLALAKSLLVPGLVMGAAATALVGIVSLAVMDGPEPTSTELAAATPSPPNAITITDAGAGTETQAIQAPTQENPRAPLSTTIEDDVVIVRGQVRNAAYAPSNLDASFAQGLTVLVAARKPGNWTAVAQAQVTTDAEGRFETTLEGVGPELELQFSAPPDDRYRHFRHIVPLTEYDPETPPVLERLALGILEGRVVDSDGQELEGIALRLEPANKKTHEPHLVTTSSEGRFHIEHFLRLGGVTALEPGYVVLRVAPPTPLEHGGWTPIEIVLTRGATLALQALGPDDEPLAGRRVSIELAPAERALLDLQETWTNNSGMGSRQRGETDAEGWVVFEGVWSGRKLAATVEVPGEIVRADHLIDDELLPHTPLGRPLVLQSGETRDLVLRVPTLFSVSGSVRFDDGPGIRDASVTAKDLGRNRQLGTARTDAEGRFRIEALTAQVVGPIEVSAQAGAEKQTTGLAGLGYIGGGGSKNVDGPHARRRFEWSELREGNVEVELLVEPALTIEGRVLDSEGQPRKSPESRIWARRTGGDPYDKKIARRLDENGNFEFVGLSTGDYEVFVSEEYTSERYYYSFESFMHRFEVAAGERGLELKLPERKEVHITVKIEGPGSVEANVLHANFFPFDPEGYPRKDAPDSQRIETSAHWPEGASYNFGGIGGRRADDHSASYGFYSTPIEGEHTLPAMGPGWHCVGLQTRSGDVSFAASASPIQYFDEGNYTVTFVLTPRRTVAGRWKSEDAESQFLAVQLVDAEDQALPLAAGSGYGKPIRILDLGATGEFVLREIPEGSYRLRAGRRSELEAGGFQQELELEVGSDTPFVEF